MRIKLLAGSILVSLFFVIGLFQIRPYLIQHIVKNLPRSLEKELSEKILKTNQIEIKLCLSFESINDYEIIILSSPEEKIFGLPDNKLILSKGLIRGKRKDELTNLLSLKIHLANKRVPLKRIIHSLPLTSQIRIFFGNDQIVRNMDGAILWDLVSTSGDIHSEAVSQIDLSDRDWEEIQNFCAPFPKKQQKKTKPRMRKKMIKTQKKIIKDDRSPLEKARDEGKFQYPIR